MPPTHMRRFRVVPAPLFLFVFAIASLLLPFAKLPFSGLGSCPFEGRCRTSPLLAIVDRGWI